MRHSYSSSPQSSRSPRERRLLSDYEGLQQLVSSSTILKAQAAGHPPQRYQLRFSGWGVRIGRHGQVEMTNEHCAVVELNATYPRMMPTIIWQSSIFHPNISQNGVVCLGGFSTHWVPSLSLTQLCTMLWDMVRYLNYDVNSAYNREAALWVSAQPASAFPLDPRPLRDAAQPATPHAAPPLATGRTGESPPAIQPALSPPEIVFL